MIPFSVFAYLPAMNQENILHLIREFIWWIITGMIAYAILYPVTSKIDYTYLQINVVFIAVTFTYFRWSISFKSLPFLRPTWIRFLIFTLNFVLFFYLMQYEQKFILKLDNFYTEDLGFPKVILYDDLKRDLFSYLSKEILLFGTGSLAMIAAFQLRLIVSYFQYYQHQASRMLED